MVACLQQFKKAAAATMSSHKALWVHEISALRHQAAPGCSHLVDTFRRFNEWGWEMGSCACLSGASSKIVPPPQMSYTLGCLRFRPWPAALLSCSVSTTSCTEWPRLAGCWLHTQVEDQHIAGRRTQQILTDVKAAASMGYIKALGSSAGQIQAL